MTTQEYFNNNQFSIDAFNRKYRAYEGEQYEDAVKRVCDAIASVEDSDELKDYWSNRWYNEIINDWWHPAGSIMQGAGINKKISTVNCTTISLGVIDEQNEWDNLESIIRNAAYKTAKYAAYRQGLGIDFSRLRPRETSIDNSAEISDGSIHWMKFIDSIGYYVGQRGRIPAMLFSLSCDHPDIEEFIQIKKDYTQIQNANISVQCSDKFYRAVKRDADWTLTFKIPEVKAGDKVYIHPDSLSADCHKDELGYYYIASHDKKEEIIKKKISSKYLLELIAKNMMQNAEPGIQNIDTARKMSNSDYVYNPEHPHDSRIISTNACSEQYLSVSSCCVLSSINLGRFSTEPEEYQSELEIIGESVNRFLDNVNEYELRYKTYATKEQKTAIEYLRRTGAGFTNAAEWLFKQNLPYGFKEGNDKLAEFTKWYNYYLYKSSINLGREKGSFKAFDREKLERSPFIQKMMGLGLEFDALRNVTCSSIAPTGTLTLMFRDFPMGYGIEPAFGLYFWKRTRISGKYEYYFCVPSAVRKYYREKGREIPIDADIIKDTWDGKRGNKIAKFIEDYKEEVGINFCWASEVNVFDKLDLMCKIMEWIDSSISVTYQLPEDCRWQDVYDFILEAHKRGLKSISAFPDKKMYGIMSSISFYDLAKNLINDGVEIHKQNFSEDELKKLDMIDASGGRPSEVFADVYHVSVKMQPYFVLVGLVNGEPYEVFAGKNGVIDGSVKTGKIIKMKRPRQYKAVFDDDSEVCPITALSTDEEEMATRLISTALQNGTNIESIVTQLEKTKGDMQGFSKAIAKSLKKYIKDGTRNKDSCPQCGQQSLIRQEGCLLCQNCQFSKC